MQTYLGVKGLLLSYSQDYDGESTQNAADQTGYVLTEQ